MNAVVLLVFALLWSVLAGLWVFLAYKWLFISRKWLFISRLFVDHVIQHLHRELEDIEDDGEDQ